MKSINNQSYAWISIRVIGRGKFHNCNLMFIQLMQNVNWAIVCFEVKIAYMMYLYVWYGIGYGCGHGGSSPVVVIVPVAGDGVARLLFSFHHHYSSSSLYHHVTWYGFFSLIRSPAPFPWNARATTRKSVFQFAYVLTEVARYLSEFPMDIPCIYHQAGRFVP